MCSTWWTATPAMMKIVSEFDGEAVMVSPSIPYTGPDGWPDVMSGYEVDSVEVMPGSTFQDYAGRPSYPGDKMPWIRVSGQYDHLSVYSCIRRIALMGLTLVPPNYYSWTTTEEEAMLRMRDCNVPREYWHKILGRSRSSVHRRAKDLFYQ
jgi:hypothetical protein